MSILKAGDVAAIGDATEIVYVPAAVTESKSSAYTLVKVPHAPRLVPTDAEYTVVPPEFLTANVAPVSAPLAIR